MGENEDLLYLFYRFWTPIQRLVQLNQAFSCTEYYKDEVYWDRIVHEFFESSGQLKLVLGNERTFNLPHFVISKFLWTWAQAGLEKIQFSWSRIEENMSEDGCVTVLCPQSQICSYSHEMTQHILQNGTQTFYFSFTSKLSLLEIQISDFRNFSMNSDSLQNSQFGFNTATMLFLDVAPVMASVLPDAASWTTWFQSYCQQNGYESIQSLPTIVPEPIQETELFSTDMQELESPPAIFGLEFDNLFTPDVIQPVELNPFEVIVNSKGIDSQDPESSKSETDSFENLLSNQESDSSEAEYTDSTKQMDIGSSENSKVNLSEENFEIESSEEEGPSQDIRLESIENEKKDESDDDDFFSMYE